MTTVRPGRPRLLKHAAEIQEYFAITASVNAILPSFTLILASKNVVLIRMDTGSVTFTQ